ncbi:uncharacterized protein TRIVIDRAFT_221283 [Trichoderma virens Gv29-8]|uniref:Uncharacterized protein n=1 Tax=Hypocrea virens (strain Gv29-8 / FGSC 10586) TaxID=413071 RepID=G9MQB2_HYPVG|nr:uncharacterized protein TRIVIDRAFT_221283 [Trichoderma virens Gv29-8]EHK24034.1 hypothetical protein TRIVIDRAFT_221283 [Trichoderma virens Gv29-8]UKZ50346.1 hypothetical protein TrVGV298_004604 [Trichoderma virens]
MPSNVNEEARRERLLRLSTSQQQTQQTQQTQQNGQSHHHPTTILYYHRGEGSGNVFRFRVGPEYFWIAGSGPGGSLTPSEEERFYRVAELAGLEWTGDGYMQL